MITRLIIFFTVSAIFGVATQGAAQTSPPNVVGQDDNNRVITTAVPFLGITPDARAGGMGDAGVATSADANSIHWNPAKLVFIDYLFVELSKSRLFLLNYSSFCCQKD